MWGVRVEKPSDAVKSQIAVPSSGLTTESQARTVVRSWQGSSNVLHKVTDRKGPFRR